MLIEGNASPFKMETEFFACNKLLNQHLFIVFKCDVEGFAKSAAFITLLMPMLEPSSAGFTITVPPRARSISDNADSSRVLFALCAQSLQMVLWVSALPER